MKLLDSLFSTVAPSRWETADVLIDVPPDDLVDRPRLSAGAAAPVPAPARNASVAPNPFDPAEVLRQRARGVRARVEDAEELARRQAAERLAGGVVAAIVAGAGAINAELGDVLSVGLTLSSARPGRRQAGLVLSDRPGGRGSRRSEYSLHTRADGAELAFEAERLGRSVELARVKLDDAGAAAALRAAVETFLLDTAEKFAAGAGE